jgi:hypothetical protein
LGDREGDRNGDRNGYGRKAGFGDFGGDRRDAPQGDRRGAGGFAGGQPAAPWEKQTGGGFAGKPAPRGDYARPGNGTKVFVPRDAKKRAYKPAR